MSVKSVIRATAIPVSLAVILGILFIQKTRDNTQQTVITARILQKAQTALDKGIQYKLGHGNNDWNGLLPTTDFLCDCVQYVTWATGVKNVYTTGWIRDDALGAQTKFKQIPSPIAGCIVVGDCPSGNGTYAGHAAIIINPSDWTIIDCGKSQGGITIHKAPYWKQSKNAVFCLPVV